MATADGDNPVAWTSRVEVGVPNRSRRGAANYNEDRSREFGKKYIHIPLYTILI